MLSPLPTYKPGKPTVLIHATVAIAVLMVTISLKNHFNQRATAATASEYQAARSYILGKIETAAETYDIDALRRIHGKYAASVADKDFKDSLNRALAESAAREAKLELTVSKHLDMARVREELGHRHIPAEPVHRADEKSTQRLSVLPP